MVVLGNAAGPGNSLWKVIANNSYILKIFFFFFFLMPPTTLKKLQEHIGFGLSVCSSKTVHARVLKFHIWIPHGKIVDAHFFFLSELSLFLELCTFENIWTKSDACHILWTVPARVLKFHIWIPHGKIADPYFFLVQVISLSGVMPLWKKLNEILSARSLETYMS